MTTHPDRHPELADAQELFTKVSVAYEILQEKYQQKC